MPKIPKAQDEYKHERFQAQLNSSRIQRTKNPNVVIPTQPKNPKFCNFPINPNLWMSKPPASRTPVAGMWIHAQPLVGERLRSSGR